MASLGSLIFYNLPVIQCQRTKKKVSHFSALNSASLYIAIILSDKRNTFKDSIPCEVFHGSKKTKKKMWRFLIYFFPLLPVLNLETNKHVVLVLLGQKMALLRVNSGTLSLRPYPHLPFFFWKWRFFLCFQNNRCPQAASFFSVTENGTIFDGSNACILIFYWYPTPWHNFFKTSIVHEYS